ncbi:MAG: ABC transporter ATP-binding protein [Nitrospirae bacterium]|nr:ABC transporter ATP-binding protein [Nitrospirota bacterium]
MNTMEGTVPIHMEGVGKAFRQGFWMHAREAVRDVSFSVPEGSLFGYLGHNGAGKTTTIKMLLGLIAPSRGQVRVWGGSPADPVVRRRVGYLPEQPYFYDYLTAREFLDFHADLCGLTGDSRRRRIALMFDWVDLAGAEDVALNRFSKGMLQRIGLAQALIGDPELVILDEPMSGLDPAGRKRVRDIMVELKARGRTVFFSTHVLADAETVCDQVAILVQGRVRSVGPLTELLKPKVTEVEIVAQAPDGYQAPQGRVVHRDGRLHLTLAEADSGPALRHLLDAGGRVLSVTPHRETLETLFMNELTAVERAG